MPIEYNTIGPVGMGQIPAIMKTLEEQGWEALHILFSGMGQLKNNVLLSGKPVAQQFPIYGIVACKEFLPGEEVIPPVIGDPHENH
jgi:hypothetical protein